MEDVGVLDFLKGVECPFLVGDYRQLGKSGAWKGPWVMIKASIALY